MTSIDLTADTEDLAEALISLLSGEDFVGLYGDASGETDGLYRGEDVLPTGEDAVHVALSRAANKSDTHLAFRLALAWERL